MTKRLTGQPALAYQGVEAATPANSVQINRAPRTTDYVPFNLGDYWLDTSTQDVWVLVNKNQQVIGAQVVPIATWVKFAGGLGDVVALQPDVGAVVYPDANGIINLHNPPAAIDGNILTENGTTNGDPATYLDIRLADSISITNNIFAGWRNQSGGIVAAYNNLSQIHQFNFGVSTFNSGIYSGGINMFHARGTNLAPTATITGDQLGELAYEGYDGANPIISASITAYCSGTIAANRVAGELRFNTHPDAVTSVSPVERVVLNSAGNLTINTPDTATIALTVNAAAGTLAIDGYGSERLTINSADTSPAYLSLVKKRGSGALQSGDHLGNIVFMGYDGSSDIISSQIVAISEGTIAANRVASQLEFYTHPDSTTASTQRMRIRSTGNVVINSPDNNGLPLTIANSPGVADSSNVSICCGAGDPNGAVTATKGSLYLRVDGSSTSTRAYINTDGNTAWTSVTTAT